MFEKLVAIEPVSLIPSAQEELRRYAKKVVLYEDIPGSEEEIARRIGDADGVLLSYTSQLRQPVLKLCPNIRYIGMCCSLYSEASANVDIAYARERGIQVLGIRDYGDRGVVEYVLYQLIRILHGFDFPMWEEEPLELTNLPARPKKATRLQIQAKPVSDRSVKITIRDLGLGEFFKASDMVWEHVMKVN